MLVKFDNTCVTKQTIKPSVMKGGQPEMVTEIVPATFIDCYLNPEHVTSLDVHPTGATVISTLTGGRLVASPIDEVAAKLSTAVMPKFFGGSLTADPPLTPPNDEG